MFQSEPICIFTAGKTVDGREFGQEVVDDIAENYNPETYNARINEDHWSWGEKFGSVLSVEKRGNQLWAVLKPNALFFDAIQKGQLLHTSCELQPDFAGTGKWYLTGLALTDSPASLGTTEIHLSAEDKVKGKVKLSTGETVGKAIAPVDEAAPQAPTDKENLKLLSRIKQLFSSNAGSGKSLEQDENEEMDPETKLLLEQQTEALTALTAVVTQLSTTLTPAVVPTPVALAVVEPIVAAPVVAPVVPAPAAAGETIETLSAKIDKLTESLSKITDENPRQLAGAGEGTDYC